MSQNKSIEQIIAEDGKYITTTKGISMRPLFKEGRDTVIVLPKNGRLKKYDVPLYRRGDERVLHRVIKVLPDSYIIRGDNCINKEFGITDEDVLGVMGSFYRGDRFHTVNDLSYRAYSVIIVAAYPLLMCIRYAKRILGAILRKLHLKK